MVHCRAATHGNPKLEFNNHPFLSKDNHVAVVHNGKFSDLSYNLLKDKYYPNGECDSELFLKILEKNDFSCMASLEEVWTYNDEISMALAIGQSIIDENKIYLSRNDDRPLWIFDLRDILGQIFFCSNADIFSAAIQSANLEKQINNIRCCEMPSNEIWHFSLSKKIEKIHIEKFKILFENKNKKISNKEEMYLQLFSNIKSLNDKLKNISLSKLSKNESFDFTVCATQLMKIQFELKSLIKKI